MPAANFLTNSGFETANLAGWATFGPDNYSQSSAGVAHRIDSRINVTGDRGPSLIQFPGTVTNPVTNLVAPAGTFYVRYQVVF